jgi:hypothetical protein
MENKDRNCNWKYSVTILLEILSFVLWRLFHRRFEKLVFPQTSKLRGVCYRTISLHIQWGRTLYKKSSPGGPTQKFQLTPRGRSIFYSYLSGDEVFFKFQTW